MGQLVHTPRRLPIKLFFLPVWLEQAIEAFKKPLSILNDPHELRRILSDTDVEFYIQSLGALTAGDAHPLINPLLESVEWENGFRNLPIPNWNPTMDLLLKKDSKTDSLYGTCQLNNTRLTQVKPFLKDGDTLADSVSPELGCVRPVFKYISDEMIIASFERSTVDITVEDTLEDLIGFLVSRFGLKEVAQTPIFRTYSATMIG